METVKIIYRHPNPRVMAEGPKILDYRDPTGKMHYCDPDEQMVEVKGNKIPVIVYETPIAYGRRLLSRQPDRYFLLSPDKLIIPRWTADKLGMKNEMVKSVLVDNRLLKQPEPAKEEKPGEETQLPPAENTFINSPETPTAREEVKPAEVKDELPDVPDPAGPYQHPGRAPAGSFARPTVEE